MNPVVRNAGLTIAGIGGLGLANDGSSYHCLGDYPHSAAGQNRLVIHYGNGAPESETALVRGFRVTDR